MDITNFNNKYKFKVDGFYYRYIYKYIDYQSNIYICNNNILINKDFTINLIYKKKEKEKIKSLGIIAYSKFKDYNLLIQYINKKIVNFILKNKNKIIIKELIIYIWEFDFIWNTKLKIKEEKEKEKKIKLFNKKVDDIIAFKFDMQIYSNYKLLMLLKGLNLTLSVKLNSKNEDDIEECTNHLYYLIKKWKGYDKDLLKKWIFTTVEKHKI